MKNKNRALNICIAVLSGWSGIILIIFTLIGVQWFHLGDFSFRTAMAYHGILIPAWLMLVLAYFRYIEHSNILEKLSGIGAVSASVLTGIGAALIHKPGFSLRTGIQVTGMILAEITVLSIIIISFRYYFITSQDDINKAAWWTVSIGLIAMLLALPLGHLAGAAKDLGDKYPLLLKHAEILNLPTKDVIDGYIDSHSHQVLAAFLAAAFTVPLIRKSRGKSGIVNFLKKIGLFVIVTATIAQSALYQYCAWFGWEPPNLFSNGSNGLPLDDFILVILGLGMLLLIPALLARDKSINGDNYSRCINRIVAIIMMAFIISVVAIGVYIEFHEQYFGHGEGHAPGVLNDMAYIRAHLLFGFMIVPILLGTLLNANLLSDKKQLYFLAGFATLVIVIGFVGTFVWTFFLNSTIIKISVFLTVLFLLVFAFQLVISTKHVLHSHILEHQ